MNPITSLTRLITGLLILGLLAFPACRKENSGSGQADQQEFALVAAQTNSENAAIFDDVFDNVLGVNTEVGIGGTGVFGMANSGSEWGQEPISGANGADSATCFTVTVNQLNPPDRFPLQIIIDFGSGCTDRFGRTRKGKIVTEYTGPLTIPGNSASTTFDGYSINDIQVYGNHIITNKSTQDTRAFEVAVSGAKISWPNGDFSEWNSKKTISQVEGLGTPLLASDDVFNISGGANGSVKKGDRFFQWGTEITEPLVKRFTCRWFEKGVVVFRKSNVGVAQLDFGTGACDNKATLTVNGQALEISLH